MPLIVGADVLVGADAVGAAVTAAVAEDVATDDPYLFDAVTLTRSEYPTSLETGLYDDDVAPESFEQAPDESQWTHWYA